MSFDEASTRWDNPFRIGRAKKIAGAIKDSVPAAAFGNVMEFGCGTGLISFSMIHEIGKGLLVDSSEGMIRIVHQKIEECGCDYIQARCADFTALDDYDGAFSLIYGSMALHHVHDLDAAGRAFSKALEKSGFLCIVDLCKDDGLMHKDDPDFNGHHGFDFRELSGLLEKFQLRFAKSDIIYRDSKIIDGESHPYGVSVADAADLNFYPVYFPGPALPGPSSSLAACPSGSSCTSRSLRSMARVRTPALSISLLADSSFCLVFSSTSPNLPNSVRTAPRRSQISLVRFSTARSGIPSAGC